MTRVSNSKLLALILMLQFSCQGAFAGGLAAPFEVENASVLPPSIRNPRLKNINSWIEGKYNAAGTVEGLGEKLNKSLIWDKVISSLTDNTQKNLLKGTLASKNLSSADSVGNITGAVNAYVNANVPVLAIGVTDRWTLALAVPVYKVELSADTGFIISPNGQNIINEAKSKDAPKAAEMTLKLSHPLSNTLQTMGYKPITSERFTALGDIKLVSKYKLAETDTDILTFKSDLTFPTGRVSDVDKLVELPTGDGQYDLGFGLIWDHKLLPNLTWNFYAINTIQLADKLKRRIPTEPEGSLSADIENVDRDSGDQYLAGTSVQFGSSTGGIYANLGYIYQSMQATRFKGHRFSQERYDWLENQYPSQMLTSMVGQVGYSSIESYKSKEFPIPLQANLGFGHPLSGRNATAADVYMAELVLFF